MNQKNNKSSKKNKKMYKKIHKRKHQKILLQMISQQNRKLFSIQRQLQKKRNKLLRREEQFQLLNPLECWEMVKN